MTILTVSEKGTLLTETLAGVAMPAEFSFACVSDFVSQFGTTYEELQYLCLGIAEHIDKFKTVTEWANTESRVNSHFDAGYESARTWVKLHLAAKRVEVAA